MAAPDSSRLLPNIKVSVRDLTPHVIVVGDPQRVHDTGSLMADVREIGNNREYLTITGTYRGLRMTVASHGVGAGGANVCFMELLQGGARLLIRAGTCGALAPEIDDGDLIIATGAVREDAATEQLMPLAYPAVADHGVVGALIAAASRHGIERPHAGLAVTAANFYSAVLPPPWKRYVGYSVKAVEMELAALLVVAGMHGARAGGILTSDGNLVREPIDLELEYDPHRDIVARGKAKMLEITLDAMANLIEAEDNI
jgi:uridine phosphorylase